MSTKAKQPKAPKTPLEGAQQAPQKPVVPVVTEEKKEGFGGQGANRLDLPPNPLADQIAQGVVQGITGVHAEAGATQDSEAAKQPVIQGEINESVVNPVAPPVEPQGVPEAVIRATSVPNAMEEPTFHTGTDYERLKAAFEKLASHGTHDVDFIRGLKKEAGIL